MLDMGDGQSEADALASIKAIAGKPHGAIAVAMVEWGAPGGAATAGSDDPRGAAERLKQKLV